MPGFGAGPSPYFDVAVEPAFRSIAAEGVDIAAVEHVLFSPFHLDHVGWATNPDGHAFFPNARYHAPEAELAYWRECGDAGRTAFTCGAFEAPYRAADREQLSWEETPGEIVVRIGRRKILPVRDVPVTAPW